MRVNKHRVQLRFARAAATYDRQATIQRQVAERLLSLLKKHVLSPPKRILEIGCCTGLLTRDILNLFNKLETFYVNDLVPDFESRIHARLGKDLRVTYLPGDIEQIDIPGSLDLVVSSSTLHWLEDLPSLFGKIDRSLVPGGYICFSIYGPDNLQELRKTTGIGLDYLNLEELKKIVGSSFEILSCGEQTITLHFRDARTMLNHLRETGVNALDMRPWTKSRLDAFIREYTRLFGGREGVPLTYHPVYCIARKQT